VRTIVAAPQPSLARVTETDRPPLTVGLVQTRWHEDPDEHAAVLDDGIASAAAEGAEIVFLPELTLLRYPADTPGHARPSGSPSDLAESLEGGATYSFAAAAAARHGVVVHASLYERADAGDGLGLNTAILVAPDGTLLARTRKLHIPVTAGYYEDTYFRPGPADGAYPVAELPLPAAPRVGLPTCWDEWFPEVARAYSLGGAELLAYPTAIGSEPDHPDFDTEPLWRQVIVGHGIANGLFMVVPNRWGSEGLISFYGSSFVSDPYGRVLAQAPREGDAALVATLDLAQRRDWLDLFPFLATRRPDTYGALVDPVS
jgi:N-carbamoylputrescine amidase